MSWQAQLSLISDNVRKMSVSVKSSQYFSQFHLKPKSSSPIITNYTFLIRSVQHTAPSMVGHSICKNKKTSSWLSKVKDLCLDQASTEPL